MANVYGKKTRIRNDFPSAARTSTVASEGSALPEAFDEALLMINITAVSGTVPTLVVSYQVSPDDGTTWFTKSSTATLNATGQTLVTLPDTIGRFYRLNAVIGGTTPSFTFAAWVEFKRTGEG